MIITLNGIKVQTNQTLNLKVRRQIALFIEGKINQPPPAFLTKGGKILLCKLSNGKKIHLLSTFPDYHKPFVVQILSVEGQIIAKVFPRYTDYKRVESFVVKDEAMIYHEAKPVLQSNVGCQEEVSLANSRHRLAYRWGVKLQAWWKLETNEPPGQIEKTLSRDGIVHLCPFNNEPVSLKIAAHHPYEPVVISCTEQNNSRWVTFTLKTGLVKEFWLVKDSKICFPPNLKFPLP
jgi:hypothetical protein